MLFRLLPYLILLGFLGFTACGPVVIYGKEQPLPESGWSYADTARFTFEVPSTEQAYDLILTLDHTETFPSQNFYVRLHTEYPSGKRATQQLSLQLAGQFGAWLGACNGEVCQQDIKILRNARFEDTGNYSITVEQFTRENPLSGITKVGLIVQEHEPGEA